MERVDINKFKNTKENKRVRRLVTIPHFLVLVDKYFEGGEKDKALKDKLERELVRFISVPGIWKYVCKDGNVASPVIEKVEPVEEVVEPVIEKVEPVEEVVEPVEEVVEPVEEVVEPVEEVVEPVEEVVEEESNEIETVNE